MKEDWLASLVDDIVALYADKRDVLVVSSGAIALGRARPRSCRKGRSSLRTIKAPRRSGRSRWRAPGAKRCRVTASPPGRCWSRCRIPKTGAAISMHAPPLTGCWSWRAVPVINENDTVATNEIRYGDNDRLAARVASMASADLLVLLSDVDGLYDAPPGANADAKLIPVVERITPAIEAMAGAAGSELVARRHADQDRSRQDRDRRRHPHGDRVGPCRASPQGHRAGRALHMVSHSGQSGRGPQEMDRRLARAKGTLIVDAGAVRALQTGKSLLPAGVVRIEARFARGDAVLIRGPDGARGRTRPGSL